MSVRLTPSWTVTRNARSIMMWRRSRDRAQGKFYQILIDSVILHTDAIHVLRVCVIVSTMPCPVLRERERERTVLIRGIPDRAPMTEHYTVAQPANIPSMPWCHQAPLQSSVAWPQGTVGWEGRWGGRGRGGGEAVSKHQQIWSNFPSAGGKIPTSLLSRYPNVLYLKKTL